jgi:hypothetical protein
MSYPKNDNDLDKALTEAFAPPPVVDFDAWQKQHSDALAYLDPQQNKTISKRRSLVTRTIIFATAAIVLLCVWLGLSDFSDHGPGSGAFAQVLDQIAKAKTITWKTTFYNHATSKDGKRTWIVTETRQCAYKSPGLYREVDLDKTGKIKWVQITDNIHNRELQLCPEKKEAVIAGISASFKDSRGPFEWVNEELKKNNLQWVEKRKTATGEVNIFRHSFRDNANGRNWSYDFWIDQKTKRLVEVHVPGDDIYDPYNDPGRNNPPEKGFSTVMVGTFINSDINLDAELDESLFQLEPPMDYTIKTKGLPQMTEKEMVDYLGIAADYNDKTFPDQVSPFMFSSDRLNKIWYKPKKERTPAEQKLIETGDYYRRAGMYMMPVHHFVNYNTIEMSFLYLGKGVKLGDKDRIVCWYKLKDAKDPSTYRVVYGDLSVKDVAPEDLPLPVEP